MPSGGVGIVTVTHYPKNVDYLVVVVLIIVAAGLTWLFSKPAVSPPLSPPPNRRLVWIGSIIVFAVMLFVHDHPYSLMDPFHEGEHLTPAFLFRDGARPFGDVFILHGLGVDGGLDAIVLGDPPSPLRTRRLETILDAAALALLVPIAAELCVTSAGAAAAVLVALCAIGSGQVPVFPYFRFAPMFVAVLGLLRYQRTGRWLFPAFGASTLGMLWSLDTGLYAVTGTAVSALLIRPQLKRALVLAAIALALPVAILLAVRADVHRFLVDSFVIIPRSIDAIWSRPARTSIDWESARYYIPPIFYGWLLATGVRKRNVAAIIVAVFSIIAFRSAAGRCSWSHTRYGIPLFGVAIAAYVLEPLVLKRRRWSAVAAAIPIVILIELIPNVVAASKFIAGWKSRQSHAGLVPYPLPTAKTIYTTPDNAADLAALSAFISARAGPGAAILDASNEKALYYLLQRRPPTRCFDIPFLSAPALALEARAQLQVNPPACVIVEGMKTLEEIDGIPNRVRVPWLFTWIDENYPRRVRIGRFVVATK